MYFFVFSFLTFPCKTAEFEDYYGIDKAFSDVLLKPALSATFNEPEVFSAAEMLMFSHFYFTGDDKVRSVEQSRI